MFLVLDHPLQEDTMKHRSEARHRLGLLAGAFVFSIGTACLLTPAMGAGESGSSGGGGSGGGALVVEVTAVEAMPTLQALAREVRSTARDPVDACRSAARF